MSTSTDIHAYRMLADHLEYVYRGVARKKDASEEEMQNLQLLLSRVNQAYVTAAHAVRTEIERGYVIEIRDKTKTLTSGQPIAITDPMRFLESAVLEGDSAGALEYFQALNEKTKLAAFECLCKNFGSASGKIAEDGIAHVKKDPISALLLADKKSAPLYLQLKNIEENLSIEALAKNPQIAGVNYRVEIMNETLAALAQGSYVSPENKFEYDLNDDMKSATKNVEVFTSGSNRTQRPGNKPTQIRVENLDCLYAAIKLCDQGLNPIVVDMANNTKVGGGYRSGARAQEEDLFRRTTLSYVLDVEHKLQKTNYYPLDKHGQSAGLYVPNILVIRAGKDKRYAFLESPFKVAVSVVAAFANPALREVKGELPRLYDNDADITFERVCTVLEMAYEKGHRSVVLGALGCGAFRNPPDHMAELIISAILQRYAHCFDVIVIAITEDHNSRANNSEGNFIPFARRVIQAGGKAFNDQGQEVTLKLDNTQSITKT